MEKLISKRNILFVQIASVIASLLIIFYLFISINGASNGLYEELGSVAGNVQMACLLFYVDLFIVIILLVAFGYLFIVKKQKDALVLISGGIYIFSTMIGLSLSSSVSAISNLASGFTQGNFESMLGSMFINYDSLKNVENLQYYVIIYVIIQITGLGINLVLGKWEIFKTLNEEKNHVRIPKVERLSKMRINTFKENLSTVSNQENGMKCENCGTMNELSSRFCEHCGKPLIPQIDKVQKNMKKIPTKNKNKKIYLVIGIVAALFVGVLGGSAFFFLNPEQEISLTSNCEYSFSGENGQGTITYVCLPDYDKENEKETEFVDSVFYDVENNGFLSNGDEDAIVARYDKDIAKMNHIVPIDSELKIEVNGLSENFSQSLEKDTDSGMMFSTITNAEDIINELKKGGLNISDEYIFTSSDLAYEEISGVTSKAYFEDAAYIGQSLKPTAYLTGGTIEICTSNSEAQRRLNQVNSIDDHKYMYNYVFGNIFIRLDKVMSLEHIKEYEKVFDKMNDITETKSKEMRENNL